MRFITEQELQLKNRQKKMNQFFLANDERLTPGARQFLTDHQISLVTSGEDVVAERVADETLQKITLVNKCETFFSLLEIELWEAALKARDVCSASCKRITDLTQYIKLIETENFDALSFDENDCSEPLKLSEISKEQVFQPGGKAALKLRRAMTYATTLKTYVTLEQKTALEQVVCLLVKEIIQLERL